MLRSLSVNNAAGAKMNNTIGHGCDIYVVCDESGCRAQFSVNSFQGL
jgi:hypothetical protein